MNVREEWWAGSWGSEYTSRNRVEWEKRIPFWRQILDITQASSVLDVGTNAGWNLLAIRAISRSVRAMGIDINADAVGEARTNELDVVQVPATQAGVQYRNRFDLVCTSGVLIHVGPEELADTMRAIVDASRRWVLAVEYEAEAEEEVLYRGHADRLWKRDYGRLYEALGLTAVAVSDAEGFDRCRAWLMCK